MKALWGSGNVPRFKAAAFTFAIDVPDELASANPSGMDRFTLRQTPMLIGSAVPEPASFGLVGLDLVSIGFRYVNMRPRESPSPTDV
jgi:hypothetical protein